jgi:hypothetical protein
MKPTAQQIQDIVGQVTELTWSYAIWWELVNKENRPKFKFALGEYPNFFSAVVATMLASVCVIVRRLFDSRTDVLSIPSLVNSLQATHPQRAAALRTQIDGHSALIQKFTLLRHKVYAHRDGTLDPAAAFNQAQIKPKELREVVHLIQEITGALCEVEGKNSKATMLDTFQHCERDAAEETGLLIQDIRRSRGDSSAESRL